MDELHLILLKVQLHEMYIQRDVVDLHDTNLYLVLVDKVQMSFKGNNDCSFVSTALLTSHRTPKDTNLAH